jgi:hypothetical protein
MKPVKFQGHNMTLAEDQPEYQPLPVCYQGGNEGAMTSCWKLTWRERVKLFLTGLIYFNQYTSNQPLQPQLPMVDWKEPVCKNCGKGVGEHKQPAFNCPSNNNAFRAGQRVRFQHWNIPNKRVKEGTIIDYEGILFVESGDSAYSLDKCENVELVNA